MEKRIELEKRGRPANQITELNLDNCRSTNIVGLTDEFTALETLSLINVGLTSLKGFPKLPNLRKLELSDNRISNGLNNLSASTKLTNLNLSGNKIKDVEELRPLENFKELQVLDLFNNEATSIDSYRQKIFAMIPSLVYLDGFDVNDVEAVSEGEDDDDVNGNDSEEDGVDDYSKPFCINGMEIDLDELERFEKQLADKRKNDLPSARDKQNELQIDELDEYLEQLAIDIQSKENRATIETPTHSSSTQNGTLTSSRAAVVDGFVTNQQNQSTSNDKIESDALSDHDISNGVDGTRDGASIAISSPPLQRTSFPLLLYSLLGILVFINSVHFSDGGEDDGEDDGEEYDEEEDEEDDEENGDASLADVYNEDLEDDNSDYVEEGDGEENESDLEEEEEEEGTEKATGQPQQPAEEESPARGTKRKHEDDNDG